MSRNRGLSAYLSRTRRSLAENFAAVFSTRPRLDESLYEDIEDHLIMADFGMQTARKIVDRSKQIVSQRKIGEVSGLFGALREAIVEILSGPKIEISEGSTTRPRVILMVGVNGVGKTTTLAKMANRFKQGNHAVMLAACDTFRAAAIEQLQTWGDRLEIPVISQSHGADAAAVAFDAYHAARARGGDYLLIDSAGRQHTHADLMAQLSKIKRVLSKAEATAPHDVYITVDAGNGQNMLSQVENFNRSIPLTGICVTKLDGTARGGGVVALTHRFGLPVRYIGVGEGMADLKPFDADAFVSALLPGAANP